MASFATQVQIRRGTDAENNAFTGAEGEVTMDLTEKTLRVHDGERQGGTKIINENYYGLLDRKITNCILQMPRNINITANGNQITIASGTKYYVPNGVGTYTEKTLSQSINRTIPNDGTRLVLINPRDNGCDTPNIQNCFSQNDQPSSTGVYWWDLTNNQINSIATNGSLTSGWSLPLALIEVKGGNITIKNVFYSFGFMGITIYTTPDLLVAVPNGRNSDGTLKNATAVQTRVNVYTLESFRRTEVYAASTQLLAVAPNTYTYDFEQNKVLTATGDQRTIVKIGTVSNDGSTITGIDINEPFAAVDYNEYVKDLSNINETLEDKASISEPQTIGGKYTFTQTIDINDSLGMQINRALDSGGTTAWRVYDATNSRQIRALGFYANSKIYNRLSIVGKTGIEGYLNFYMTDDGTMNIELGGDKEYLPSKGANNASFATTKWVQRELTTNAVRLGMPNYNAAVIGTTPYTAPADGYAFIWIKSLEGYSNVRVGGLNLGSVGGSYNSEDIVTVFVPKNEKITTEIGTLRITFCPVKGA